jgi:DNA polymerase III sliding clamp (beta) subunit (PCNA family)
MKLTKNQIAEIGKAAHQVVSVLKIKKAGTLTLDFGAGAVVGSDYELDAFVKAPLPSSKRRVVVDAKKFCAICSKIKRDVEIESTDDFLTFTAGATVVNLAYLKLAYGSQIEEPKFTFTLPAKEVSQLLQHALTISSKKQYPAVEFSVSGGAMWVAATDGQRLLFSEKPLNESVEEFHTLIGYDAAKAIVTLAEEKVSFLPTDTSLVMGIDEGILVVARKSTAKFPKYEELMKTETIVTYTLDAKEALESLERIGAVLDDTHRPVTLTFYGGTLSLELPNDGAKDAIKATSKDFDPMFDSRKDIFKLNYEFLADLFSLCEGEINVQITEEDKPIVVTNGALKMFLVRSK